MWENILNRKREEEEKPCGETDQTHTHTHSEKMHMNKRHGKYGPSQITISLLMIIIVLLY